MNLYENAATEAIASFFYHEPRWKNEILFDFLLEPFGYDFKNVKDVTTQDVLKGTIPDFTMQLEDDKGKRSVCFEVKINNDGLTEAEKKDRSRDAFLIRKNYIHVKDIRSECKILYWEDLFEKIDKKGAMKEFARLALIREYMNEPENTLLLSPMEVAMLYSPETIAAVYTMSKKVLTLCKNFLDANSGKYEYSESNAKNWKNPEQYEKGIGYYFNTKDGKDLFIGISPQCLSKYSFSVALDINSENEFLKSKYEYVADGYAMFPLDREILAKYSSEKDLQEAFNKNAEEVLKTIFPSKK